MFNVRIKKFLNTEQIQIFSEPLLSSGSEREDKRKVIRSTGEIVPTNRRIIENPFNVNNRNINFKVEYDAEYEGENKHYSIEFNKTYSSYQQEVGYYILKDDNNISRSVRRTKNKIYDYARCNEWNWFFTLTLNEEKVNRYEYEDCAKKVSKWLNHMRALCPDMKYLVVPEQHKDGAWHFHGLFANVENLEFVNSGKIKKGKVVYNVGNYKFGWSTATQIESLEKAMAYITKYVTKQVCLITYNKKRYWASRNLATPVVEDYFIENMREYKEEVLERATYLKEVDGFVNVMYIERPIYTTNTDRFVTSE